jgi:hypothetical protein
VVGTTKLEVAVTRNPPPTGGKLNRKRLFGSIKPTIIPKPGGFFARNNNKIKALFDDL